MKTPKAADKQNLSPGERGEHTAAGLEPTQAEEAMKASEMRFKELLRNVSAVSVQGYARDGTVTYWNRASEILYGYTAEEALSRNLLDLIIPPSMREDVRAAIRWMIETGQTTPAAELELIHKDGSLVPVYSSHTLVLLPGHEPELFCIDIDLTELKKATEALRETSMRLQESVRAANVGLWDWDLATHRVRFSPEWKRQIGYEDAEIGDGFEEWESRVHPEDLAPTLKKVDDAITGERQRYQTEFRFRHKDGSYRWILAQCSLLRDKHGKVVRVIGSHIDLTDRKKTEAEREEALLQAEAASHAKSEFLAVMSHELRSPLNGVLGFAELLSGTSLDDEQRAYVRTISSSGGHLLSLVNDILEYASMEHGAMKVLEAPFALAGLLDISRQTVSTIAAEKGIGLHSEIAPGVPEQILGDERRIRQILINLLSNAVKFTTKGSVVLRIAPALDGTRRFLDFSIEDSGIGISPEMLARLFQPFTQADSKLSRAYGGTGLGLSISKHLAEAMGGSISVTSTPGMGSRFTFRFPLKLSPCMSPPLCPEKPDAGSLPDAPVLGMDDLGESCKPPGILPQ